MSFFYSFSAGCVALPALINIKAVIEQRQCTGVWNQKDELPVSGGWATLGQISKGKCCFQVCFVLHVTGCFTGYHLQQLWGLGLSAAQGWGSQAPQTPSQAATQATPDTALPQQLPHRTHLKQKYRQPRSPPAPWLEMIAIQQWKHKLHTHRQTRAHGSSITARPPQPPFPAFPPQSPSSALSSYSLYSSADLLSSETLRFTFVPVAKSRFGCSFLMTCQDCFLLLSPLFLSIRFVPLSFVCCPPPLSLVIPFHIGKVIDKWS